MNYKIVQRNEYHDLAEIHLDSFKGFFLATLGKRFLLTYYKAVLGSNETISVCAVDDEGKFLGFGTGCVQSKGYHKRLILQNPFSFLVQGLIILFTNPKALKRLGKNLDKISSDKDDGNYAELISICVSHLSKGTGIGRSLLKEFEEEVKRRKCKKITLTTDYFNNKEVMAFYLRSGYKVLYEFTANPNRRMYKLIKDLQM